MRVVGCVVVVTVLRECLDEVRALQQPTRPQMTMKRFTKDRVTPTVAPTAVLTRLPIQRDMTL